MPQPLQQRVLIPNGYWTPFRNVIFGQVLRNLKQDNSAALFARLYDQAYHHLSPIVKASIAALSAWAHLDSDEVEDCLQELAKQELILKERPGSHSGTRGRRKPRWRVPLAARFDLNSGH